MMSPSSYQALFSSLLLLICIPSCVALEDQACVASHKKLP